jgi:hypothetical protein
MPLPLPLPFPFRESPDETSAAICGRNTSQLASVEVGGIQVDEKSTYLQAFCVRLAVNPKTGTNAQYPVRILSILWRVQRRIDAKLSPKSPKFGFSDTNS